LGTAGTEENVDNCFGKTWQKEEANVLHIYSFLSFCAFLLPADVCSLFEREGRIDNSENCLTHFLPTLKSPVQDKVSSRT